VAGSQAWLQLLKAPRQALEQSSPGVTRSRGLAGASVEFDGAGRSLAAGAGAVGLLVRVAMGGGEACTLVGAGTTK
jgi:hypothetical protein